MASSLNYLATIGLHTLRVVNCAGCSKLLTGESHRPKQDELPRQAPPLVAGRDRGRPYCSPCLAEVRAENDRGYGSQRPSYDDVVSRERSSLAD